METIQDGYQTVILKTLFITIILDIKRDKTYILWEGF